MVVAKPMNPEINVFLDSIKDVKFLQPDGNPLPEWKLFLAPTLFDSWGALYEATKHHPRDAVRETTQNAIYWALQNENDWYRGRIEAIRQNGQSVSGLTIEEYERQIQINEEKVKVLLEKGIR